MFDDPWDNKHSPCSCQKDANRRRQKEAFSTPTLARLCSAVESLRGSVRVSKLLSELYFNLRICLCASAVCSGEITDSAGVILSPNWPEAYDKGQDCIWGVHVEEDKRIMLDIQV